MVRLRKYSALDQASASDRFYWCVHVVSITGEQHTTLHRPPHIRDGDLDGGGVVLNNASVWFD